MLLILIPELTLKQTKLINYNKTHNFKFPHICRHIRGKYLMGVNNYKIKILDINLLVKALNNKVYAHKIEIPPPKLTEEKL